MRHHQITIKDIAQQLSISPSTVSRALKDHPDININTRKTVKELAKKLNYKPNKVALSLLNNSSKIIGVIVPEIIHHFFSSVISGIEKKANAAGYNLMICQSNESYEKEINTVQALLSSHIDGIIISISKETKKYDHLREIQEMGIPLVFFDRICNEINADNVIIDDFEGAYKITEHLINTGRKNIIHLSGPQNLLIGTKRKEGYISALKKNNISVNYNNIVFCDTHDMALKIVPKLLKRDKNINGILAVNDETAIGAIKAIKKNGLKIPEDIAVAGFTNSKISQMSDPDLTTIDQRGFEIGETASELLINKIDNPQENKEYISKILKTELIIRNSTIKE
ncbi:MAG: LacI family DNA-binding transcriptional regulator [Bacteroidales bacterium]|jgi:DNA-binding LacI/PurR family transcriptional regulator|nr:LacI family DNA-binding transcriptional regulator [Bacteroidales bacterium]